MQSEFDRELQSYFTDVEPLREMFKQYLAALTLPKRILVIHGVGGVGKSSLLRMFRLHCKGVRVPVALASGDEAKSALDVLTRWTDDLKVDDVAFLSFGKKFEYYRAIQAKVDTQAKKSQAARGRAAGIVGKAVSKTAEAAGGALAGAVIGSAIPGIGTAIGGALGGVLGGMGAEALVDWLRGFLKEPDIDLLLDPAKKLTEDFLSDIALAANKRRIVLMLDTFEQMTALDDWVRSVVQQLHRNVLLVIAGRVVPNWDRAWPGWMMNAQVEELKPMTEDDMRELVRRYYATMRGGEPNPAQVEAIIRFAHGLPLIVTSAVQLWVKYGVEDFQSVKPAIVANLVDRLIEGVPSALIPALEATAIVRWFDQPILRAVMKQDDVRDVYNELRRFPFVRTRAEGLALHDAVREIMEENLRVHDPERHRELHERAAAYFEKRLEKVTGEEAERLGLERLYHCVRADEETGIKLFQKMAEELTRYRLVNRLRALLNDVNTYPLERENSRLWREYYNARLAHLERRLADAEKVYQAIEENKQAEPKLRAYALCDWGDVLARAERLSQAGGLYKALDILYRGLRLHPEIDSKLVMVYSSLRRIYDAKADWQKAIESLEQQLHFFEENSDKYGIIQTLNLLYDTYGVIGDWRKAADCIERGLKILETMRDVLPLKARLTGHGSFYLIWSGRYIDAQRGIGDAITFARDVGDVHALASLSRDFACVLGLQGKYEEATEFFVQSLKFYEQLGVYGGGGILPGFWGATLVRQGEFEKAEQYLTQSLSFKRKVQDDIGIPEIYNWLGELYEVKATKVAEARAVELTVAEFYFRQSLDYRWTRRHYFECGALTGLVRVKHAQGDYAAIPPLLAEAEQLAQQYEYNDHLASLRLTQGHIAWEGNAPAWENGFDAALHFYQHALIYALRYNRFLLDEVLSGCPQGTPLRSIIPYCLARGDEGRRMLIALRNWWKTGVNDIGTPRPDTISPIPEDIPLLKAERIAREREPGDSLPQKTVVEKIEEVLQ